MISSKRFQSRVGSSYISIMLVCLGVCVCMCVCLFSQLTGVLIGAVVAVSLIGIAVLFLYRRYKLASQCLCTLPEKNLYLLT